MDAQRKTVEIYLRIKGPPNILNKPDFKLLSNDTKIRFKQPNETQQQSILNQFAGVGIFNFEKIFRENAQQQDVFNRVALDLVDSAIEGYNGTIFAYGQTGSGKTYTMTGGDDDPSQMGIIPRIINEIYKESQARQEQIKIKLKYMQIYKKSGYDLLQSTSKSRKLQQLPQVKPYCKADTFEFENLSEHEAPTFQQAMKIYQYGDTNRIVCKTPSNDQSSRSHCILMITVKTKNRDTGLQQKATINLVDLAGSQRVHNSGMEQQQAKQGISINLGLHYLSRVVISLGEQSKGNDVYIPYRDSLLTMALKSSMGGNCKTRMIATINPNNLYTPQSIATCKFSQNLLAMQNKIKKNQFINPWDIIKGLKNEIEELKGQISRLKGENVKEILEREDYIKIHKMVDKFIQSEDPVTTIPINDRLYIREYLSYMKSIIRSQAKNKSFQPSEVEQQSKYYETAISENYIFEMKSLREQIQQKQNQIQLLLSLINHKKQEGTDDMQDNIIPIEEASQQKIAETVAQSLMKNKKKVSITAEQVEKNLIKPIKFNKSESVEQAFKKFKDAHIKSEELDEKEQQIKMKSMKKQVVIKKIKNLKNQRAKVSQRLNELGIIQENVSLNLPSFHHENKNGQDIQALKQQLSQLDDLIKKKYQELKSIELQIDRLSLCKSKNNKKLKMQFDEFISSDKNLGEFKEFQFQSNSSSQKLQQQDYQQQDYQQQQKLSDDQIQFITFKDSNSNMHKNRQSMSRENQNKRIKNIEAIQGLKLQKKQSKADQGEVSKQMQQFFEARKKIYEKS